MSVRLEIELTDAQLAAIAQRAAELIPAPESTPADRWLTPKELAGHLGMSPRWVTYRLREGMPHVLIAGRPRFKVAAAEAWLEQRGHLVDSGGKLDQSVTDANGAAPRERPAPGHEE